MAGIDVFGHIPTGYGKSLMFQLLPGVCRSLNAKGYEFPANPLELVNSPLVSIVEDQEKNFSSLGMKASYIEDNKTKSEISEYWMERMALI